MVSQRINITASAAHLDIHGNGATLTAGQAGGTFVFADSITLRDLTLDNTIGDEGYTLTVRTASLYHVTIIAGAGGLSSTGAVDGHQLVVHNLGVSGGSIGVSTSSTMTIDGGKIYGGSTGVTGAGTFQLSNLLIYGQAYLALDLSAALAATVSFSTIVGSETAGAVSCNTLMASELLSDSIIWVPNSQNAAAVNTACGLTRMIVGPISVAGAANTNPQFVNLAGGDYHLGAGSPAIDMVNQGPATDFEGDARPQGARFDTGADEYKP